MFGSIDAAPMTISELYQDRGHKDLTALLQHSMDSGEIKANQYTAKQLALLIWFLSHGIAMLSLTLFRDDQEFADVANQVILAFGKTLITSDVR
jgi:hypothetical protein